MNFFTLSFLEIAGDYIQVYSGVHNLRLLRWMSALQYAQGLSCTVGFLCLEQLFFTEGQVLAGEFCFGHNMIHRYTDSTLPISTSLMSINKHTDQSILSN